MVASGDPQKGYTMAKIKFGGLVSAASGKLAGNVFARNKGGSYVRNWARPTNPQTTDQQAQRTKLANKSAAWRNLTDTQRDSWKTWADDNPVLDRLGNSIQLTGAQAYSRVNINRDTAGDATTQSSTPSAPTFVADIISSTTALAADASAGTVIMTLGTGAAAAQILFIKCSRPVSAGVTNTNSDMRQLPAVTLDAADITAGTIDIGTAYTTKFGIITDKTGLRINTSARQYDEGLLATAQEETGVIVA